MDGDGGIDIGVIVWSTANGADGTAAHGGMVVDVGITDDGERYVEVLDGSANDMRVQHMRRGGKQWKEVRTVGLRRMFLADLDLSDPEPASPARMQGYARQALISAGAEDIHTRAWDLVIAAGALLQESKARWAKDAAA